jgi:phosphoglycerate dehydrogenase-like enzyme
VNILLLSPVEAETVERLRQQHDVREAIGVAPDLLGRLAADREVFVFRSGVDISADLMRKAPRLRFLVRAGSGTDNVDLGHVRSREIAMVRIPSPSAQAVAEFTFALILELARNVSLADRLVRDGRWTKHQLVGRGLTGKTLGILGAGNIGSRVGELGVAWGMEVIGCVERPTPDVTLALADRGITVTDLDGVMRAADFVTVHLPLGRGTRNAIDARALSLMKNGSYLVNVARGGIVDEEALFEALVRRDGLSAAALDVHAEEADGIVPRFAALPNVVLTPHIGAMTLECQREIGARVIDLLAAFERGTLDRDALAGELVETVATDTAAA